MKRMPREPRERSHHLDHVWPALFAFAVMAAPFSQLQAQERYPLDGAPYSAGVSSRSGATLAVFGNVLGTGPDVAAASRDALDQVVDRLEDVGLDRDDLVRVRAALAPGSGDGGEFSAWNQVWVDFFGGDTPPARTTVGASGLPGDALITLDAVAVFPEDAGVNPEVSGARSTLNPNLRLAGSMADPIAIVSTNAGLFFSSGALPSRDLADPESMDLHMRSSLSSLGGTLADHGLDWPDVFFVRSMPTPQPDRDTPDLDAWGPVNETLAERAGGVAPPYTLWAAPGFSSSNRYSEIEVWAAPRSPHPIFAMAEEDAQNPRLRMTGTGFIANGAIIAPYSELVWLSGVVAPEGTAPGDEGRAALDEMEARVAAMGATMADVAELRVYRLEGEEGFGDAYGVHFNNPDTNPHRPVRTNYLVESLPGNRMVEVEAVVVLPPTGF